MVVVQGKSTAVRRCTTSATMAGVWCYSGSVMVKMTAGTTLMNFCVVCGSCHFCSVCQLICTKNIFDKSSFAGFLLLIKSHVAYGSTCLPPGRGDILTFTTEKLVLDLATLKGYKFEVI